MITIKNLEIENPNFTNPPTEITLKTPLTILAGANGSGKSTLLRAIKNAVKNHIKIKQIDITLMMFMTLIQQMV